MAQANSTSESFLRERHCGGRSERPPANAQKAVYRPACRSSPAAGHSPADGTTGGVEALSVAVRQTIDNRFSFGDGTLKQFSEAIHKVDRAATVPPLVVVPRYDF